MVLEGLDRWKFSAITSFAAFVVAIWLAVTPGLPVQSMVAALSAAVFLADAYIKWMRIDDLRSYSSLLFSFANAALIFAGFLFAGEPWSYVFAVLWILDGVLKYPGIDTRWEGRFRHIFSATNTTLLGLTLLFGVRVFGSTALCWVLGWAVLVDAYVKWQYLKAHHFMFS